MTEHTLNRKPRYIHIIPRPGFSAVKRPHRDCPHPRPPDLLWHFTIATSHSRHPSNSTELCDRDRLTIPSNHCENVLQLRRRYVALGTRRAPGRRADQRRIYLSRPESFLLQGPSYSESPLTVFCRPTFHNRLIVIFATCPLSHFHHFQLRPHHHRRTHPKHHLPVQDAALVLHI